MADRDKYDDEAERFLSECRSMSGDLPALLRRVAADERATCVAAIVSAPIVACKANAIDAIDAIDADGTSDTFYIENIDHNFDFKLWWGPKSSGYTVILEDAGVYTEAKARAQQRSRSSDIARRKSVVDAAAAGRVVSRRAIIDDDPPLDGATR